MSQISWNEIHKRSVAFAVRWQNAKYEKGETQSFWTEFLEIYGIDRKRYALFEHAVKKIDSSQGFIDMFWPGVLLVEQKSAGRDLIKAKKQGLEYLHNIDDTELPKFVVVCDFQNFELLNLATNKATKFTLRDLPKKTREFAFLIGREEREIQEQNPVNVTAAIKMADLHDKLKESGYVGHDLELLLVRLVFCLFSDDSGIFEREIFQQYIEQRTNIDGSDLGSRLAQLFEVLNQSSRNTLLDEDLQAFPYVNGGLFEERISIASFDSEMRDSLLNACKLDWGAVSPAIFGSLFQGVMDPKKRRNLGAHYTSEKNILRVLKPLFLDQLWEEFEKNQKSPKKLNELHEKIGRLKFLDPACGCGNFLVITYRELRKLELEIIKAIHMDYTGSFQLGLTNIDDLLHVSINQMYGIEVEEFPSLITKTALWLTEHQQNNEVSKTLGKIPEDLPLKNSGTIINQNALSVAWEEVIQPKDLDFIIGNPPFSGSKKMSPEQRAEVVREFQGAKGSGVLDYVAAWYSRAAKYMETNAHIKAAFVSTNSIVQGEQVGYLWSYLLRAGIRIDFGYQTFKWENEGKGKAAVYCVVIGFGYQESKEKKIFTFENVSGDPTEIAATNVNPYLVDAPNTIALARSNQINNGPKMDFGNMPNDGGNYLLTDFEMRELINESPNIKPYIREIISAKEFINNQKRWCIWLEGAQPQDIRSIPKLLERIENVRQLRSLSKRPATKRLADVPTLFGEVRQPKSCYILIPRHSSENREYIPIGYMNPDQIVADSCNAIDNASLFDFGIINSRMHMAWIKYVCGRLESRYRYSKDIVYNNFLWPNKASKEDIANIEQLAEQILNARNEWSDSSLADLYDPRTMPLELLQAHRQLDNAVDKLFASKPFIDDKHRVEFLFRQYAKKVPADY